MDFELTEEMRMLTDMAYKFAIQEFEPVSLECDEEEKYTPEIRQKAEGYGMRNERIEGMDIMEVRKDVTRVMETMRKEGGPYFLEIMTYRYRGHSMGDPERYREKEEVKKWQDEDPIGIFRKYLLEEELATEAELDAQDDEAEKIVEEAVAFAEASPDPEDAALFVDIYTEPRPVEYRGYEMAHESEGE